MVAAIVHRHQIHGITAEYLDDVAGPEIVLAKSSEYRVRRQPPGRLIVDERIVVCFRHFVTVGGDVLESADEQSGIDPAGVHHDVAALAIAVAGHARLEIIGVRRGISDGRRSQRAQPFVIG
jgi:hypothetical protein